MRKSNPLLNSAPAARPLQAWLGLVGGHTLAVKIENLGDGLFNGTLQLTQSAAPGNSGQRSLKLKPGETSQLLNFASAPATNSEIIAGLRIKSEGAVMLELAPRRFHPLADSMLSASRIVSDGDAKIAAQQSLAVSIAPEPLPGPDTPVVKVSYQCDAGWKFFRSVPSGGNSREIAGRPAGLGVWVYGDG